MKKTKQQTAAEWLNDKIIGLDVEFDMTLISRETYWIKRKEILEQANKMFEQQIMDAQSYAVCHTDMTNNKGYFDCEQYYNETFNK
jgi:hypothetical protein